MRGAVTAQSQGIGRTTLVAQYTDPIDTLRIVILRTIPRLKITRGTQNPMVLVEETWRAGPSGARHGGRDDAARQTASDDISIGRHAIAPSQNLD